jgi:hypothetical protein
MAQSILETAYNSKIGNMVGSLPYLEFGSTYEESFEPYQPYHNLAHVRHFDLERHQISSTIATETVNDLKHFHGVDAGEMINGVLFSEFKRLKENKLYNIYSENATNEFKPSDTKLGSWIKRNLFKKKRFPHYIDSDPNRLLSIIMEASYKIAESCKFGPGDFVIASSSVVSILKAHSLFRPTMSGYEGSIEKEGCFDAINPIDVYINPSLSWEDTRIIVGRSNNANLENGFFVISAEDYPTLETIATVSPTGEKITRAVDHIAIGKLSPENSHKRLISIQIDLGKKPLWRRILELFGAR